MPEDRRGFDRRVGLPDTRPPGERVERRAGERRAAVLERRRIGTYSQPTNRDEHRHLVLYLAASPPRLEWLRRFLSRHLEAVASSLDAQREPAAARIVRGIASRIRAGEVSLW